MRGQLRLLNIVCDQKARKRVLTLTRPMRDEPLQFTLIGGYEMNCGIFVSRVEKGSKAAEVGLKRGDQILEVNGESFRNITHSRALAVLRQTPAKVSFAFSFAFSFLFFWNGMASCIRVSPRNISQKKQLHNRLYVVKVTVVLERCWLFFICLFPGVSLDQWWVILHGTVLPGFVSCYLVLPSFA